MHRDDQQDRQHLVEIGKRMYERNYVAANDGNLSIRIRNDEILATPTGVSKGFMQEADMVRLNLNGMVLEQGKLAPSSEIKMHLRIYQENPDVMGICHAHPVMSTSFAVAGIALNEPIYPEAIVNLGSVPCVHYETPGTQGVSDAIAPYARSHHAVLLANHGIVTWGQSLLEAWYRMEAAEHYAQIMFNTCYVMNRANRLSSQQMKDLGEIRKKLGLTTGTLPQGIPEAVNCHDVQ